MHASLHESDAFSPPCARWPYPAPRRCRPPTPKHCRCSCGPARPQAALLRRCPSRPPRRGVSTNVVVAEVAAGCAGHHGRACWLSLDVGTAAVALAPYPAHAAVSHASVGTALSGFPVYLAALNALMRSITRAMPSKGQRVARPARQAACARVGRPYGGFPIEVRNIVRNITRKARPSLVVFTGTPDSVRRVRPPEVQDHTVSSWPVPPGMTDGGSSTHSLCA
jgi:hypothetical protein